jgi:hypothetical protein
MHQMAASQCQTQNSSTYSAAWVGKEILEHKIAQQEVAQMIGTHGELAHVQHSVRWTQRTGNRHAQLCCTAQSQGLGTACFTQATASCHGTWHGGMTALRLLRAATCKIKGSRQTALNGFDVVSPLGNAPHLFRKSQYVQRNVRVACNVCARS